MADPADSTRQYRAYIRDNLEHGITFDEKACRYISPSGRHFLTYEACLWYVLYLDKTSDDD